MFTILYHFKYLKRLETLLKYEKEPGSFCSVIFSFASKAVSSFSVFEKKTNWKLKFLKNCQKWKRWQKSKSKQFSIRKLVINSQNHTRQRRRGHFDALEKFERCKVVDVIWQQTDSQLYGLTNTSYKCILNSLILHFFALNESIWKCKITKSIVNRLVQAGRQVGWISTSDWYSFLERFCKCQYSLPLPVVCSFVFTIFFLFNGGRAFFVLTYCRKDV